MTISNENIESFTTTVTVKNLEDEILASQGLMPSDQIRSVTIENVIVNTRTNRLCLPVDVIAELRLTFEEEVGVKTATGVRTLRLFKDLVLTVQGRNAYSRCIELPEGESAILGLIPLEELGLKPDENNQQLIEVMDRV
ncbi:hypothetical protein NIES4071_67880 [Calothrix sp. NIES-4071]|nr:hypothetical protein NIES4071_67880 [Calothrix sp. NIES-4071]BAZ61066.1 hypothetical protein NIES4105_67840 [Calothrix sp. NIES-4105]